MDTLSSDAEELLGFLNRHNVRALIVGGRALAFHGQPRYTKDLDLFIDATAENAASAEGALPFCPKSTFHQSRNSGTTSVHKILGTPRSRLIGAQFPVPRYGNMRPQ